MRTEPAQAGVSCRAVQREGSLLYGAPLQLQGKINLLSQSPSLPADQRAAWYSSLVSYQVQIQFVWHGAIQMPEDCWQFSFSGNKTAMSTPAAHPCETIQSLFQGRVSFPPAQRLAFCVWMDFTDLPPASVPPPDFPLHSIISNDINIPVKGKYGEWNSDSLLSFFFGINMHILYFISSPLSDEWAISTS